MVGAGHDGPVAAAVDVAPVDGGRRSVPAPLGEALHREPTLPLRGRRLSDSIRAGVRSISGALAMAP